MPDSPTEPESWRKQRADLIAAVGALPPAQIALSGSDRPLTIRLATIEDAMDVHAVMHAAFDEYRGMLQPASLALTESYNDVVRAMSEGGALLGQLGRTPVASARFRLHPDHLYVGRLGVLPAYRGRGIGTAMLTYMETVARTTGRPEIRLGTRMRLQRNVDLYQRMGYEIREIRRHPHGPDRVASMAKIIEMARESDESDGPASTAQS